LRARGFAAPRLRARAGAGIEESAVLVHVREWHAWVALECVEHAVAVLLVDVDVRDAFDVVQLARGLDRDAAVVEHAETRGVIASRVMQAADRDERAPPR